MPIVANTYLQVAQVLNVQSMRATKNSSTRAGMQRNQPKVTTARATQNKNLNKITMPQPTYREQYDKIVDAYIKDKLKPWDCIACFIGNLLNGKDDWAHGRTMTRGTNNVLVCDISINDARVQLAQQCVDDESNGLYSLREICALEENFLNYISPLGIDGCSEQQLFEAMCSTLEMLRLIHISKGEDVDAIPLTKRVLEVA